MSAEAGEAGRGRGDDEGKAAQRRHHPRPAQTGQLRPRPAPALQLRHGQPLHQRAPGQGQGQEGLRVTLYTDLRLGGAEHRAPCSGSPSIQAASQPQPSQTRPRSR